MLDNFSYLQQTFFEIIFFKNFFQKGRNVYNFTLNFFDDLDLWVKKLKYVSKYLW